MIDEVLLAKKSQNAKSITSTTVVKVTPPSKFKLTEVVFGNCSSINDNKNIIFT